jgi:hypothetical protein
MTGKNANENPFTLKRSSDNAAVYVLLNQIHHSAALSGLKIIARSR